MTKRQLFFIRMRRNWTIQLKAWRSALDWTVWVYLLVPGLIIGGGLYRELWTDMPAWSELVPWLLLAKIGLFLMILLGRVRVFIEAADRLFLLQKPEWILAMKRYGIIFASVSQAFTMLLPIALLLPFLIKLEQLSWSSLALLYVHALICSFTASLAEHIIANLLLGWRKWAVYTGFIIFIGSFYFISVPFLLVNPVLIITLSLLIAGIALAVAERTKLNFELEAEREHAAKLKTTELLMSQVIESKPKVSLRKPWFWRRSQRIFKNADAGTILAEMRLKSYVRKLTYLQTWFGYISISSFALTLVPPAAAAAIIIALAAMGANWLRLQWTQWIEEEFIAQYGWTDQQKNFGIVLSRCWIMLPAIAVWSSVAGFQLGGAWLIIPSLLLGSAVWLLISRYLLKAYKP